MASVLDVAQYILQRRGAMSGKKLQKLVYYSQAWSLAWTNRPIFTEHIEAWRDGPVVPALFGVHKYSVTVEHIDGGRPENLSREAVDTIDSVLAFYGDRTAEELIDLSHTEPPWALARRGVRSWQASRNIISHESMRTYYAGLPTVTPS